MHQDHATFLRCLHNRRKLLLHFFSKEDHRILIRTCAPMDFGPSRRAKDQSNRYHFWDYDGDMGRHSLSLLPDQIVEIQSTEIPFEPGEFVTWSTATSPWYLARDWGAFS